MNFRLLFAGLLVPAMLCCNKPTPEPEPQPKPEPEPDKTVTATITASDVTVEEGQTVSIGAATNSSEAITYASAAVTGVKAGNTTISLKVPAVEGKFTAAEATVNVTVTAKPVTPDPDDDLATEIKDGATVLAPNADVEKFLTDVHYPTHDYTFTSLLTWAQENNVQVCPGKSDKPSEYTIRWTENPKAQKVVVTVTEPTREWVYTPTADNAYVVITNLLPNTHYTFKVMEGESLMKEGAFDTYGKVHQVYFKNVRNSRDLGGWKTEDGKTVKTVWPRAVRPRSRSRASRPNWTSAATATSTLTVPSRALSMTTSSALLSSRKAIPRCSTTTRIRPASACSSSSTWWTRTSPSISTAPSAVTVPAPSPCSPSVSWAFRKATSPRSMS